MGKILRPTYNFDEQNFDELIVGFIGEKLSEKRFLMNWWLLVKFTIATVYAHS